MKDFLRTNLNGNKVRVISDLGRWEGGAYNNRAGEDFIRMFKARDPDFKDVQVLVLSLAVEQTRFVVEYPFTYSANNRQVVWGYIQSLAEGLDWRPTTRWAIT
jgi:hypothetical protein